MARSTLAARAPALVLASWMTACNPSAPDAPAVSDGIPVPAATGVVAVHAYERSFVFARLDRDSLFLVPWLLRTLSTPDTVLRSASGWITRGGIWDPFFRDDWGTPPTRAPNRVLPHGDLSFVVREGDAIDGLIFEQGARSLELTLGEVRAAWVGPRGETFEVLDATAYFVQQRIEGVVLDVARAAEGPITGGDWAFLVSGDSVHIVLASGEEHGGEAEPMYRGWANVAGRGLQWPEVHVDWEDTQAFPPARRDIPAAWRVWSADGSVEGELLVVSGDVQAGSGPGPLLPVRALFEVSGEISTVEGDFAVRGLLVHERR